MFNNYKIFSSKYAFKMKISKVFLTALIAVSAASCNKNVSTELQSPENFSDNAVAGKKVLFVIVDGLVGSEVKAIAPTNITNYAQGAIFSYDGIGSYTNDSISNAYGWTSLLTGVQVEKHNVRSADFAGNNLETYPSIFTKLKSVKPNVQTVAVTTSQVIADNLLADAKEKFVLSTDKDAIAKADGILKTSNPDFLITQLSGVDSAGANADYAATNTVYADAVNRTDAYIGGLVKTIQGRSNFNKEEWLVVISSGKGANTRYVPVGKTWNAFEDKMHNTFIMYYNPRFINKQYTKPTGVNPYVGVGYNFKSGRSSQPLRSAIVNLDYSNTIFAADKEFSLQCKVKLPKSANTGYGYISNGFMGFRNPANNNGAGVVFSISGNRPALALRNGAGTGDVSTLVGPTDIADNFWHTLTFVKRKTGATYTGVYYMDGVVIGTIKNITASFNTTFPFCVGMMKHAVQNPINGGTFGTQDNDGWATTNLNVTDIRIYNAALADTYVQNNFCGVEVTAEDAYYNNLLGFWKGTEVVEENATTFVLNDFAPANDNPLVILDPSVKTNKLNINETSIKVCPPLSVSTYKSLMNSVDVSYQIYSWLGIAPSTSWKLDGKIVLPNYIDVSN